MRPVRRKQSGQAKRHLTDVQTMEESWGQHRVTESEIDAREALELRAAEEENAAQMLIDNKVHACVLPSSLYSRAEPTRRHRKLIL